MGINPTTTKPSHSMEGTYWLCEKDGSVYGRYLDGKGNYKSVELASNGYLIEFEYTYELWQEHEALDDNGNVEGTAYIFQMFEDGEVFGTEGYVLKTDGRLYEYSLEKYYEAVDEETFKNK